MLKQAVTFFRCIKHAGLVCSSVKANPDSMLISETVLCRPDALPLESYILPLSPHCSQNSLATIFKLPDTCSATEYIPSFNTAVQEIKKKRKGRGVVIISKLPDTCALIGYISSFNTALKMPSVIIFKPPTTESFSSSNTALKTYLLLQTSRLFPCH